MSAGVPETMPLPIRKVTNAPSVPTARATSPNTAALDHSTGSRRGTAASVERIMPVEYSPAVTSTPSTPRANWAKFVPNRDRLTVVESAKSESRLPESIPDL